MELKEFKFDENGNIIVDYTGGGEPGPTPPGPTPTGNETTITNGSGVWTTVDFSETIELNTTFSDASFVMDKYIEAQVTGEGQSAFFMYVNTVSFGKDTTSMFVQPFFGEADSNTLIPFTCIEGYENIKYISAERCALSTEFSEAKLFTLFDKRDWVPFGDIISNKTFDFQNLIYCNLSEDLPLFICTSTENSMAWILELCTLMKINSQGDPEIISDITPESDVYKFYSKQFNVDIISMLNTIPSDILYETMSRPILRYSNATVKLNNCEYFWAGFDCSFACYDPDLIPVGSIASLHRLSVYFSEPIKTLCITNYDDFESYDFYLNRTTLSDVYFGSTLFYEDATIYVTSDIYNNESDMNKLRNDLSATNIFPYDFSNNVVIE